MEARSLETDLHEENGFRASSAGSVVLFLLKVSPISLVNNTASFCFFTSPFFLFAFPPLVLDLHLGSLEFQFCIPGKNGILLPEEELSFSL